MYWSSPHSLQGTGLTWWTCLWCFFNLVRLENVLAQFGQLSTCLSCIVKLWRKLNLEQKLQLSKAKLPIMCWKSLFVNLIETPYNRMLMSRTINIWHSTACYLSLHPIIFIQPHVKSTWYGIMPHVNVLNNRYLTFNRMLFVLYILLFSYNRMLNLLDMALCRRPKIRNILLNK